MGGLDGRHFGRNSGRVALSAPAGLPSLAGNAGPSQTGQARSRQGFRQGIATKIAREGNDEGALILNPPRSLRPLVKWFGSGAILCFLRFLWQCFCGIVSAKPWVEISSEPVPNPPA